MLHLNEQFRQLDEISDGSEKLPPTVKLTLLQTAVRSTNDLRIVETLDEFQSTTHGHGSSISLSYQTYYDLLINACVRYEKTKKANIGKRRNVYNTNIDSSYVDYLLISLIMFQTHFMEVLIFLLMSSTRSMPFPTGIHPGNPCRPPFRPHSQQSGPPKPIKRYDRPIYLPPQINKLLSQDAMKALRAYNTDAIKRFHQRKVHNTEVVERTEDDSPLPDNNPSDLPESDLDIPDDPILDFVNSVTTLRIWIRLCRLIRPIRYHVPRIPPKFLRGPSTTITPTM